MKVILASVLVSFLACLLLLPFISRLAVIAAPSASAASPQTGNMTCSSDDMRRKYCPVDTRGGVQLVNQRSGSPCTFGQTWGWDARSIWVDRGCRADFVVGFNGGPGGSPWAAGGKNIMSTALQTICGGSVVPSIRAAAFGWFASAAARLASTARPGVGTSAVSGLIAVVAPILKSARQAGNRPRSRSSTARRATCAANIAPFPRRAERALFASAATRIVFITALGDMMLAGSGLTVVAAPILKLASAKPRPHC